MGTSPTRPSPALALDLAAALDPVRFAERAGIVPDSWQATVLRSTAPRTLLNCSRQSGKSTISAMLALWTALYTPRSLVLMVSPSLRQSSELFRKCADFYQSLGRPVPAGSETALRLELENGSRIISLPGKEATIRGFSRVSLLLLDEAARIDDPLYLSLRPMLAVSGGRLLAMSTPWGRRGWWFEAWQGVESWQRVKITADMCPRISPDFLAEEQRVLGPWFFDQEYRCEFRETTDQVFAHDVVMGALSSDVAPLFAPAATGMGTGTPPPTGPSRGG